jgi:C4-dicarboxylate-specific signal transduction histidine kinase
MSPLEALRSTAARKERRTSLLLSAGVMVATSAAEPLYRELNGPLLVVRLLWCAALAATGLWLPRASSRVYSWVLPVTGVASCWLFATTVWLNGGIASPDFQYIVLLPLASMVMFQDEVIACAAVVGGTLSAMIALIWLGHAPLSLAADNLATAAAIGVLAAFGALSFRRVRLAELTTQRARAQALEQLALSEHRRAQAERLASLGQLAAGVAHEINNPLYAVSVNVDVLASEGVQCTGLSASETEAVFADVRLGIGRISQIVRDLKDFSSGGTDQLQPCQVDEVIGDALRLAAFKLGKVIEVRRSCEDGLPPVTVNRRKLSQVLLNLLVNSADAMQEAGTVKPWVLVAARRLDSSIQIAVQDNGPGISADVAAHLFEPFVTSKPIGKGTGLGLALSREYVMSFGGKLELQPSGAGARFSIVLPVRSPASAAS